MAQLSVLFGHPTNSFTHRCIAWLFFRHRCWPKYDFAIAKCFRGAVSDTNGNGQYAWYVLTFIVDYKVISSLRKGSSRWTLLITIARTKLLLRRHTLDTIAKVAHSVCPPHTTIQDNFCFFSSRNSLHCSILSVAVLPYKEQSRPSIKNEQKAKDSHTSAWRWRVKVAPLKAESWNEGETNRSQYKDWRNK